MLDDVRLQVKSDHIQFSLLLHRQVMIQRKRQIGLAAAKIDNGQRAALRQMRKNVLNHFEKTIDLLEFIVFFGEYLAFRIHNAKFHQKRNCGSFLQHVLLLPVMGQRPQRFARRRFFQDRHLELLADQHLIIGVRRTKQPLSERLLKQLR
ncbi:hypothetical protein D3C74_228120 [compost metagenome]